MAVTQLKNDQSADVNCNMLSKPSCLAANCNRSDAQCQRISSFLSAASLKNSVSSWMPAVSTCATSEPSRISADEDRNTSSMFRCKPQTSVIVKFASRQNTDVISFILFNARSPPTKTMLQQGSQTAVAYLCSRHSELFPLIPFALTVGWIDRILINPPAGCHTQRLICSRPRKHSLPR